MNLPWLVWHWADDPQHPKLECLRCGWCASLRLPLPVPDLAMLIDALKAEHVRCDDPTPNTTGT